MGKHTSFCVNRTPDGFWLEERGLYVWNQDMRELMATATDLLCEIQLSRRVCLRGEGGCRVGGERG